MMQCVGQGSYAKVFKARRKSDRQIYALKIIKIQEMKQSVAENTLNEIRLLSSIDSPFIVSYKEAFIESNNRDVVIVMEFVAGGDLATKIKEATRSRTLFPEETVWRYLCQALLGLQTLHRMKIVHRDIKSANLFLTETAEVVKLGDLNIAKVLKEDLTSTQIGSPSYLAPEVWKKENYSYNCDVFSLGCVLYEMAALKLPFEAVSMNDLYNKITGQRVGRLPSRYSDELNSVISIMLTKNPKIRPSVEELLNNVIVRSKLNEYRLLEKNAAIERRNTLLETIELPKNISQLSSILPKYRKARALSVKSSKDLPEPEEDALSHKLLHLRRQIEEIEKINKANVNFVPDFGKKKAPAVELNYSSVSQKAQASGTKPEASARKISDKQSDSQASLEYKTEAQKSKPLPPPKKLPPTKPPEPRSSDASLSDRYQSNNPRTDKAYDFGANRSSIEQRRITEKQRSEQRSGVKIVRSNSLGGKPTGSSPMNQSFRDKNASAGIKAEPSKRDARPRSVQQVREEDYKSRVKVSALRDSAVAKKPLPERRDAPQVKKMSRVSSQDPKKRLNGYLYGK